MRRLTVTAALIGALLTAGCGTKLGKTPVCEDPNLEPRTRVVNKVSVCRCVKPGEKWAPIDGGPKCDYVKKGDK